METSSSGESTPKRHSRHGSSGRALPRRSTRGPLDLGEAPISATNPLTSPSAPGPSLPHQGSSLLSPSTSQYMTPRLPSPQPGSNLSTLTSPSFRTAHSTLSVSPSRSPSLAPAKNFSFLLRPEIYHPLTLLDVPPPFRVSALQTEPSTPVEDLVKTGHFRSAAIKAAQLLTSPDLSPSLPTDIETIFSLIYTRLACLTLCGQTALAAQEVKALEDLNSSYYRDEEGRHLVPWELRVLAVRLQGMGFNDARRGVMGYYELAREARLTLTALKKSRASNPVTEENNSVSGAVEANITLWETRLEDLGIRVASALVEMDDLEGAAHFLSTLSSQNSTSSSPSRTSSLETQKALLYLCIGDVDAARSCITPSSLENEGKVIIALAHMADSDFSSAVTIWEELISSTSTSASEEIPLYRQNLAVCLLYLGRMSEVCLPSFLSFPITTALTQPFQARATLESLIEAQNAFHALTFNLSTIYELCTERSRALKIGLAERVAGMEGEGGGEGRKWAEMGNGDFKL